MLHCVTSLEEAEENEAEPETPERAIDSNGAGSTKEDGEYSPRSSVQAPAAL